jgi:NAD(P)-dependent dehydrogenase (short-subunit alcohol dehydrogenase family)
MANVVVVTGGSRGIGAATAAKAAAAGFDVAVNYRSDSEAAAAVVAEVEGLGRRAVAVAGDVAVEADVISMFERAAELGPITAVVNNAGILHQQARLDTFSVERLQEVTAVNVIGAFLVAREGVRRLSTAHGGPGGAIVNVSSAASYLGSPNEYIDYAATKGALDTMTVGLAKEVAAEGVRVNAVRPGLIETEIHASGGEPGRVERLAPAIPMQRGGSAHEVADVICYLLSDASSYVTGTLVNVSGGR